MGEGAGSSGDILTVLRSHCKHSNKNMSFSNAGFRMLYWVERLLGGLSNSSWFLGQGFVPRVPAPSSVQGTGKRAGQEGSQEPLPTELSHREKQHLAQEGAQAGAGKAG